MTLPASLITSLSVYLHDLTAQRKSLDDAIVNLESFVRLVTPPTKIKPTPPHLVRAVALEGDTLIAVEVPKSKKGKSKKGKKKKAERSSTPSTQAQVTPVPSAESNIEKARAARWTPEARRAASR